MLKALAAACCVLVTLYLGLGIFSFNELVILHLRDDVPSWSCWFPHTTQRQVQLLVTFLAVSRAIFFLVAIFAWDASLGVVDGYRSAFYSLDELCTAAFFSLTCTLALFWAEVYYTAIDSLRFYRQWIRPLVVIANILAYIAVCVCTYLSVHTSSSTSDYIYWYFSVVVAALFFLAAIIFTFYAQRAAAELVIVPVQLQMRRERTDELYKIFAIFMFALIVRAAALLALSDDHLDTDSTGAIVLLTLFFVLLEWVPALAAAHFYRVQQEDVATKFTSTTTNDIAALYGAVGEDIEEREPLRGSERDDREREEEVRSTSSLSFSDRERVALLVDRLNADTTPQGQRRDRERGGGTGQSYQQSAVSR